MNTKRKQTPGSIATLVVLGAILYGVIFKLFHLWLGWNGVVIVILISTIWITAYLIESRKEQYKS